MERKIGEIFEYNGEWYQCVEAPINEHSCNGCQGCKGVGGPHIFGGECDGNARKDGKFIIFKKLEKVGEPYDFQKKTFQTYKLHTIPFLSEDVEDVGLVAIPSKDNNTIEIEIKQNKEDMEEKKDNYDGYMDKECIHICDALNSIPNVQTTESCCGHCKDRFMIFLTCDNPHSLAIIARVFDRRYIGTSQPWYIELQTKDSGAYYYFIHSETKYDSEEVMMKDVNQIIENIGYWCDDKFASHFKGCDNKPTSAPFDINLAKAGKPVRTRDGRKARIICFDKKEGAPIVALVEVEKNERVSEEITLYYINGHAISKDIESKDDLMMLTEKKEGWVNLWRHESGTVHPDGNVYSSKEKAVKIGSRDYNYVATVKIEWEE